MKVKNYIFSLLLIIGITGGSAFASDPMFNGKENSLSFGLGFGTSVPGLIVWPNTFVPYSTIRIQYSQPDTFFKIPGRQNIDFNMNVGYGIAENWDWHKLNDYILALSQDIFLLESRDWYFGLGAGAGMQANYNDRIGSLLLFQFRWFVGYRLTDSLNTELFFNHYSNGHTTDNNKSYNFYGFALVYKF